MHVCDLGASQWCVAKNGGGYTQRGVAKGLKVPCLFMITEVSICCQKNPEVGIRRIPAYTPQYTTGASVSWLPGAWRHLIASPWSRFGRNRQCLGLVSLSYSLGLEYLMPHAHSLIC